MTHIFLALLLGVASAPAKDATVEAMALSHQEWMKQVTFKANYRFALITTYESVDVAVTRGARSAAKSSAKGVFIKRGVTIRRSLEWPSALHDSVGPVVTEVNDEVVGDGRLLLTYHPKQGNFGDQVLVARAGGQQRR